jgi:hypothetical protein
VSVSGRGGREGRGEVRETECVSAGRAGVEVDSGGVGEDHVRRGRVRGHEGDEGQPAVTMTAGGGGGSWDGMKG